jgi:hypothetical protein
MATHQISIAGGCFTFTIIVSQPPAMVLFELESRSIYGCGSFDRMTFDGTLFDKNATQ